MDVHFVHDWDPHMDGCYQVLYHWTIIQTSINNALYSCVQLKGVLAKLLLRYQNTY